MASECGNCMYSRPPGGDFDGICRRGEPKTTLLAIDYPRAIWPIVRADEACGEYQGEGDDWRATDGNPWDKKLADLAVILASVNINVTL